METDEVEKGEIITFPQKAAKVEIMCREWQKFWSLTGIAEVKAEN